jgi:hypothetical protein
LNPKLPPGTDDKIICPGASSDKILAEFENSAIASALVVAPTLIAEEIHAGNEMLSA